MLPLLVWWTAYTPTSGGGSKGINEIVEARLYGILVNWLGAIYVSDARRRIGYRAVNYSKDQWPYK